MEFLNLGTSYRYDGEWACENLCVNPAHIVAYYTYEDDKGCGCLKVVLVDYRTYLFYGKAIERVKHTLEQHLGGGVS
jgi:hypothetical protein